jgi:hypothetical protein
LGAFVGFIGNQPTLEQIVIAARSFCEKNALKFPEKTGRPPILSFSGILALLHLKNYDG